MLFRRRTRAMDQLVRGQLKVRIHVVWVEEEHSLEVTLLFRAPLAPETGFIFNVCQLSIGWLDGDALARTHLSGHLRQQLLPIQKPKLVDAGAQWLCGQR